MLPMLAGEIERRILVNYRVDPAAAAKILPAPFRPQTVNGFAVAGICLIRLGSMRPRTLPAWAGLRSENAAHRIAVEWDTPAGIKTGVFIPRRDSNSRTNVAVGGRLYPGEHHRAQFDVSETPTELRVGYSSGDGVTHVQVAVRLQDELVGSGLFEDTATASAFFEAGSVGFSATRDANRFDGLQLVTSSWTVEPAEITSVRSSFFEDATRFPRGSAEPDCALVMRNVPVAWRPLERLHGGQESSAPLSNA
ncbi:MAG: hypothetical protein JWQ70_2217 [Aeromicrobium sp.]|nr:hypothetical protein [Aeromicrobium sp.]